MANDISTLSQQISTINRVKSIQTQMAQYQQQIATGVKYQDFKEYGADSQRIQRYRSDITDITGFLYNITVASTNIKQMDSAVSETIAQAGNVLDAIDSQLAEGSDFDVSGIKQAAATALQIIQANMNSKVGDRYLFAGTDVSNQPYTGDAIATSNTQARVTDWMNGTTDTDTFLSSIEGMTDSQLGYSGTLSTAKNVYARGDTDVEVDYTVLADNPGFKKMVAGLNALANISVPVAGTDLPTNTDFHQALDSLYKFVQSGIQDLRGDSAKLASAASTLNTLQTNHENDQQNLQQVMEKTESTDVTEAAVKFQALQNQLEASYRVTSIISQLSLSNYLVGT